MRARSGEHGDFPGAFHAHGAALESRAAARLDESGKADADKLAAFAPLIALAQEIFIVGHLERFTQRLFIIAGVVLDAGAGGVRELIGPNKILATNFQPVHAQHGGRFVE